MNGALAAKIGNRLIDIESRGHGDVEGAMHRLEAKTGISRWTFWAWRHRPPSQGVLESTWEQLVQAYELECARQRTLFEKELAEARKLRGSNAVTEALVGAAVACAGEEDSG